MQNNHKYEIPEGFTSCEEELPTEQGKYLVIKDNANVGVKYILDHFCSKKQHFINHDPEAKGYSGHPRKRSTIVAWMKLPPLMESQY